MTISHTRFQITPRRRRQQSPSFITKVYFPSYHHSSYSTAPRCPALSILHRPCCASPFSPSLTVSAPHLPALWLPRDDAPRLLHSFLGVWPVALSASTLLSRREIRHSLYPSSYDVSLSCCSLNPSSLVPSRGAGSTASKTWRASLAFSAGPSPPRYSPGLLLLASRAVVDLIVLAEFAFQSYGVSVGRFGV